MKLVWNNLYRGKRPMSFSTLNHFGVVDVINLQSGAYEAVFDDEYESEVASDFGVTEHNIECSNIFAPTNEQIRKVLEIAQTSRGLVYIHCKWGRDRTGFMCAAYRIIVCKWHPEKAIKEMLELGFRRWAYFHWIWKLRKLKRIEDL